MYLASKLPPWLWAGTKLRNALFNFRTNGKMLLTKFDMAYRPQAFANETKRIEFLFELYDKYTAGLFVAGKKKR